MTHLKIEQNNSAIEQVSSAVITKLYELATSGDLDQDSNLVGRLHTTATYQSYIDSIRAEYPDVYITSDKYYLYMGDSTFTQIMATRYGDGVGCILSDLTSVGNAGEDVFGGFSGNTNITDATGLKYFTNILWSSTHANYHNGFKDCTNLQRCELPEGMTNLSAGSYPNLGFFRNCSSLTYVKLPSTITQIGQNTFSGCSSLQSIDLPNNLTTINSEAFSNSGLTQITLPSGLQVIGEYAFYGCTSLTSIHIPSSVTDLQRCFVGNCLNLTSITFDQSAGSPLTIRSGGGHLRGAFGSGTDLMGITTLDFPERFTTMNTGDYFFCNLPNLTTVIFRGSTPPTCTSTSASFWISDSATFYVPDNSVSAYQSATVFSNYASRIRGISELPQS